MQANAQIRRGQVVGRFLRSVVVVTGHEDGLGVAVAAVAAVGAAVAVVAAAVVVAVVAAVVVAAAVVAVANR